MQAKGKRAPTDKPNIILINCDDLGYGDLGCYGSTRNATPCLDRLAAEGLRLTDFYMTNPVCTPSRGSMLTGCYAQRIGFGHFKRGHVLYPGSPEGLHADEITIAGLLRGQGYTTQMVGKWHCGDQPPFLPTRHGFDHYYGLPYSNDMGRQAGRPDKPERPRTPLPLLRDETVIQAQPDQAALTERYVEVCRRFMHDNADRPFFLYLAHMYVHRPIFAPENFMRASRNGRYGAGVACMDWSVGAVMQVLDELGLRENTLVVFTSDNGSRVRDEGGSNAPLRGTKATTWEGGMRVPCIMHWRGQIPPGAVGSELVTSMEFLPTFAALAGGRPPDDRKIDGLDIRPLLRRESGARSPRETLFYYRSNHLNAVRSGPWKLFVTRGTDNEDIRELYNLEQDIGETVNVYQAHPEVVRRLTALIEDCRADLGDAYTATTPGPDVRPVGMVDNPRPLAVYDPEYPYIQAEYDLADGG